MQGSGLSLAFGRMQVLTAALTAHAKCVERSTFAQRFASEHRPQNDGDYPFVQIRFRRKLGRECNGPRTGCQPVSIVFTGASLYSVTWLGSLRMISGFPR
jgi:hypothetical protein